jgi:N-acetylmuramoyl-L-alanine amidase
VKLSALFTGVFAALLFAGLSGCDGGGKTTAATPYRLSIFQLSQRLALDVTEQTDRYVEMKNGTNRVLIFIHDGGRVFVNQVPIGNTGPVTRANGTIYLPEILESLIRPHLRSKYYVAPKPPKPKWTPPKPTPKVGGTILIDAGHGGKDPGAISYLGYYEKSVTLKIAAKLSVVLKARGFQTKMVRTTDTFIDKYDRAELANRINPDLFVSVHCDANERLTIRGYSVWVCRSASQDSRMTAGLIEDAMTKTGLPSRGVREADYIVLTNTQCPAILVECGHISNPSEASALYDPKFQDRIAAAIADGVTEAMKRL